jgi:site-specific recombinase XerD
MNNIVFQDTREINLVINDACMYLRESLSYAPSIVKLYRKFWKLLSQFTEQNGYLGYNSDVGKEFLDHFLSDLSPFSYKRYHKNMVRSVRYFNDFYQSGKITTIPEPEDFSSNIGIAIESYLSHRQSENRFSQRTLHGNRLYMSKFIHYLNAVGITEVEQLNLGTVLQFLQTLDAEQRALKSACIIKLRCMFRYWYEQHIITVNFSGQMPKDVYKQQAKLPSVYTASEIGSMLDNIDRANSLGKRDYAIIMLLSRYGLRASDVCRLKFENILWEENKIVVDQYKTGNRLELPLLKDVGEAIIDYLKYGRPQSALSNVFLKLQHPCGQMSSGTIYDAVNKAMRFAGIKHGNRRRGSHIFRHSLASLLLKEQSVLPVISGILGHASTASTGKYMRVDMESLRKCALEVPMVESNFYIQGGGWFYEN